MKSITFDLQLNTHQQAMNDFAIHFTNNIEDANDLVQDTFAKALSYSASYTDGTNLQGWLYTIMKNTFINNYRKSTRSNKLITKTEELDSRQLMKSSSTNMGVNSLMSGDIDKALRVLPAVYRLPFLKYFEGYKYHEIALELNIPIGTVKTRIHQARLSLKQTLKMYRLR